MKCFSLGYARDMFAEVGADYCVGIRNGEEFFRRFATALENQLPNWGALTAEAHYWDFARIPFGMSQPDLMFLKDAAKYSCQNEYRIVLLPPAGFAVTGPYMR